MRITIYELLGLIKDRKMPKKIKYYGRIYTYDNYKGDSGYVDKTVEPYKWFVKECDIEKDLNDTVEIIEEENKIEKLSYKYKNMYGNTSSCKHSEVQIIDKLNEVIDEINKLKEDK